MEWTHQIPTRPGLYLRNNPPINAICKCFVISIDGVLNMPNTADGGIVKVDKRHERWWWYGPIPLPEGVSFIEEY